MANKPTYAGSIGNSGTIDAKALYPTKKTKKGKVLKGTDLRTGTGKGGK